MRGSEAILEVADAGPGIAPEHRARVFERFYRADMTRSRADGETGLGLAIVKWTAERMRGEVELESEVGRGSVFRLRLPLAGGIKQFERSSKGLEPCKTATNISSHVGHGPPPWLR